MPFTTLSKWEIKTHFPKDSQDWGSKTTTKTDIKLKTYVRSSLPTSQGIKPLTRPVFIRLIYSFNKIPGSRIYCSEIDKVVMNVHRNAKDPEQLRQFW